MQIGCCTFVRLLHNFVTFFIVAFSLNHNPTQEPNKKTNQLPMYTTYGCDLWFRQKDKRRDRESKNNDRCLITFTSHCDQYSFINEVVEELRVIMDVIWLTASSLIFYFGIRIAETIMQVNFAFTKISLLLMQETTFFLPSKRENHGLVKVSFPFHIEVEKIMPISMVHKNVDLNQWKSQCSKGQIGF